MARSPFTLPALREAPARRMALPSGQMIMLSFVLVVVGLLGGGLLALHWQTRTDLLEQPVTRNTTKQSVEATILKLEAEQAELKHDLTWARARLDSLQATNSQDRAQLGDITTEIANDRIAAGLVPLEGPGVIAIFQDSTAVSIPSNEDPAHYILHDYNIRDILNTLWASGAEAISLNGERILATTSIYCVGPTVIANATRLSPPYEVHAIGNPDALEAGLHSSPQMQQFNISAEIYDLPIEIRKGLKVPVPAYSGAFGFKYAHPGDAVDDPAATPAAHP
ncbi:MAG TPA: DUF881 domain-containing protein [Chloroflexia bacterium]|nr:DUF881 domain-containing protein [Chloroflexia bacterium]